MPKFNYNRDMFRGIMAHKRIKNPTADGTGKAMPSSLLVDFM